MNLRISKITKTIITAAIIIVIFFFLGRTLYSSWSEITAAHIKPNIGYLVISIVFLISSFLLGIGYSWFLTLKLFNKNITFWQAVRTSAFAQFGKYIPGKLWVYGGRIYLAKMYGVNESESTTALLIETITSTSSAVVIFIISLITYENISLPFNIHWVLFLIPLSFILIYPKILKFILMILSKLSKILKLHKGDIVFPELKFLQLLYIYFFYFMSWVVHTIGFYFLTSAIYPIPHNNALSVMGAYAISWTIGFLVILIPGGFGVREGLLTLLLQNFMPFPFAALMAFVGRLWTTLGEICYFLISLLKKQ